MTMRRSLLSLLTLAGLAGWPGPAAASDDELGHVVGVDGVATARVPGRPARTLVCGDAIHEGERLETAPGARLVVAHEGRHLHLGPGSLWIARENGHGEPLAVLLRGDARLLNVRDRPASLVATAAGPFRSEAADLGLHRDADGSLQLCDWSAGARARCRRVDPAGRVRASVEEGPRLDLGLRGLCPWQGREGLVLADFGSPPPVASPPAAPFEPELDLDEPGCHGDECTPTVDLPDPSVEWTVAPPIVFIP
jgi:hypothetical protein